MDVHAFADKRPLMLGCVQIPHARGLSGHSDADVVAHALIDALLGAAALGDIGMMFPSSDAQWKGAAGADLLSRAAAATRSAGYGIVNVDTTVIAQQPRVSPHVGAMRQALAGALQIDITCVSVKATTPDGLGFTGRGDGIAAFAVVLLE